MSWIWRSWRNAVIVATIIIMLGIVIIGVSTEPESTASKSVPNPSVASEQSAAAPAPRKPAPLPKSWFERAADCVDAWDGNHNGFEDQVRERLNDEGSMQTHSTGVNDAVRRGSTEISIYMTYSAANALGGRVKTQAAGWLDVETCDVEVIDYGLD